MTRRNTEIQYIDNSTTYGLMPYGKYVGRPTVSVKLSSSEQNAIKVNSLENIFVNHNWKDKISSGYARLRIFGYDPFSEEHEEAIEYLIDIMDPRFLDLEIEDKYIDKEPSRFIQRKIDTYTFFIDLTKDETEYDPDTLDYLSSNHASHGNVQYIFKVNSPTSESDIRQFRREYNIYDSEIWLYPQGRKAHTVQENREAVENIAKRNRWNLTPRMDAVVDTDEQG